MEDFSIEQKRLSREIDYIKSMQKTLEITLHLEQKYIEKCQLPPNPSCAACGDVRLQLDDMIATLEDIQSKLQNAKMLCVFYGGTSNGKSTTINALLGKCILPSSMGSTTQVVTRITGTSKKGFRFKCDQLDGSRNDPVELKRIISSKASKESVINVYYPRELCSLLKQNIEIIDTPEVGTDVELDKIVQRECLDADVVVLVLHSVKTITLAESEFVDVIKKRFGSANIFLVWNWWDECSKDGNDQSRVRQQHLENSQIFLKKMNADFSEEDLPQRVHFVSAFEALSQRDKSVQDTNLQMLEMAIQTLSSKQKKSKTEIDQLLEYQRLYTERILRMKSFMTFETNLMRDIHDHAFAIKIKAAADGTKSCAIRLQKVVGSALRSHAEQRLTNQQLLKEKKTELGTLLELKLKFQQREALMMAIAESHFENSLKKLQQQHVALISTSVKNVDLNSMDTSNEIKEKEKMEEVVKSLQANLFSPIKLDVEDSFKDSTAWMRDDKEQRHGKLLQALQTMDHFPITVNISCPDVEVVWKEMVDRTTFTFRKFFQYCTEEFYKIPLLLVTPFLLPVKLVSLISTFNGWDKQERIQNLRFVLQETLEANLASFYDNIRTECVLQFKTQIRATFIEVEKSVNDCLQTLNENLTSLEEKEKELSQKMEVHTRIKFYTWLAEQRIRHSSVDSHWCDESMYY